MSLYVELLKHLNTIWMSIMITRIKIIIIMIMEVVVAEKIVCVQKHLLKTSNGSRPVKSTTRKSRMKKANLETPTPVLHQLRKIKPVYSTKTFVYTSVSCLFSATTILRNATGPGIQRGLQVLVDTLACGWLATAPFAGLKVLPDTPKLKA